MASVLVPVLYIIVVFGSLFLFSHFYRKRTAARTVEPYFDSHPERDTYITLLQQTNPHALDAVLKAALVHRAMANVTRIIRIREDKPALQNLLQKGSIGDDLWNSFLAAEKELEAEIMEVVAEANTFVEGWGSVIFQTAGEMIANEDVRSTYEKFSDSRAEYERKYGRKMKAINVPPQPAAVSPPSPATASPIIAQSPPPTANSINGLIPPSSAGAESTASSDGEGVPPSTPLASPRTPSKSSAKKNKKRK